MIKVVRIVLVATLGALGLEIAFHGVVYGHGFGERYDLPVPLHFYFAGSGAAVALSFVVISLFMRGTSNSEHYPRINILRWRLGRALASPILLTLVKMTSNY